MNIKANPLNLAQLLYGLNESNESYFIVWATLITIQVTHRRDSGCVFNCSEHNLLRFTDFGSMGSPELTMGWFHYVSNILIYLDIWVVAFQK